jgi:hypothetical protein
MVETSLPQAMEPAMKSPSLAFAAAAALLTGCGTTPYSRLEGERYFRTAIDTYPVMVTQVDDESTSVHIPVLVEPGRRRITVQAYPTHFQVFGELRTIELDVAPCTRYWLVAVKQNPLASDFEVKVDYTEPIAGCVLPST